jgi:hypothetical protein
VTVEQVERMKSHARSVVAAKAAGKKVDPAGLRWAKQLLAANPKPYNPPADTDEEKARLP